MSAAHEELEPNTPINKYGKCAYCCSRPCAHDRRKPLEPRWGSDHPLRTVRGGALERRPNTTLERVNRPTDPRPPWLPTSPGGSAGRVPGRLCERIEDVPARPRVPQHITHRGPRHMHTDRERRPATEHFCGALPPPVKRDPLFCSEHLLNRPIPAQTWPTPDQIRSKSGARLHSSLGIFSCREFDGPSLMVSCVLRRKVKTSFFETRRCSKVG